MRGPASPAKMLARFAASDDRLVTGSRHHCRSSERPLIAVHPWRWLARIGAGVALAVQLLLPFMAMPQMAFAAAEANKAAVLAQATAAWGSDALCAVDSGTRPHGAKSPLSDHPCPVCWAMQQAASLLAPVGPPLLAPPIYIRVEPVLVSLEAFVQGPRPPSPPRGPPSV